MIYFWESVSKTLHVYKKRSLSVNMGPGLPGFSSTLFVLWSFWLQVLRKGSRLIPKMRKRFRSMASKLWDPDSSPSPDRSVRVDVTKSELQLENEHLREKVLSLQAEIHQLKLRSTLPHDLHKGPVDLSGFKEPWICKLRQDVVCLPRLATEILPQLQKTTNCDGRITFDIAKNPKATASQVARHVERSVSNLSSEHPAVFKMGITASPVHRWCHPVYGYSRDRKEKWQGMKILSVNADSFSAALLESFLISKFKGTPGCRNENPGGETASPGDGPFFTYVVYRILVPPPRVVSYAVCPA